MTPGTLPLFDPPDTVPTPKALCPWDPPCRPRPRAEVGPRVDHGECVNYTYRCLQCGRGLIVSERSR